MVLLFSLLFFTLLQRTRRSRVLFLQRLISRRAQRRRQAALLRVFTVFALQVRRPRRIAWVLPRPQNRFKNLLNSNALNMWCGRKNFRFTRETFPDFICTAVAPVNFFLWHTHATKATKDLHFDVFQAKRDAIKWNLSSARLPTSIYWLTTLGFQFNPSKHVR